MQERGPLSRAMADLNDLTGLPARGAVLQRLEAAIAARRAIWRSWKGRWTTSGRR